MEIRRFKKLLVANRSEIAIRVFRAAHELGIRTVAIYSHEDRFALHRFKADEAYQTGTGKDPVKAYLDIEGIIQLAKDKGIGAIHPGYGFLSENAGFARACEKAGIVFIGPRSEILELLGNKISARQIAGQAQVPILPEINTLSGTRMKPRPFAVKWDTRLSLRLPMEAADGECVSFWANLNW